MLVGVVGGLVFLPGFVVCCGFTVIGFGDLHSVGGFSGAWIAVVLWFDGGFWWLLLVVFGF